MMEHTDFLEVIVTETGALAAAARAAGPARVPPATPDWTMTKLVKHTGTTHRWATAVVERGAFANPGDLDLGLPDDETEYPGWLERGAARLVDVLGAADPEAPTWSWGTDQRVGFWSRRMAHETAVHRWDAQTANGAPEDLRPDLAVDGIDERLENLAMSMNFNEPGKEALTGAGETVHLHATDAPGEWLLRFGPEGFAFEREHAKGDLAVRAPASDLLLLLVGRRGLEGLETFGDPTALATHDAIRRF